VSSNPILRSALLWGGVLALVLAVVAGGVGFAVDGSRGLVSGLLGTLIAAVFLGITAGSILFANRFSASDMFVPIYFGVVMGGWLLKFVLFLVAAWILREQPWVNAQILFLSLIVGVIGTLVIDCIVIARSRMPYASDVRLPEHRASDD
jgi:F0F1-type ATP synthase assembly protein I